MVSVVGAWWPWSRQSFVVALTWWQSILPGLPGYIYDNVSCAEDTVVQFSAMTRKGGRSPKYHG